MSKEFVFNEVTVIELSARPGGDGSESRALTPPECDFCTDNRVRWEYDCGNFELRHLGFGNEGGWLACDRCSELVEANDAPALLARSVRSWKIRTGSMPVGLESTIRQIQAGFLEYRFGDRKGFG